jgi:hypothetical protein
VKSRGLKWSQCTKVVWVVIHARPSEQFEGRESRYQSTKMYKKAKESKEGVAPLKNLMQSWLRIKSISDKGL